MKTVKMAPALVEAGILELFYVIINPSSFSTALTIDLKLYQRGSCPSS